MDYIRAFPRPKSKLYQTAATHYGAEDLKTLHSRCAVVKLYFTEITNRVVDRGPQIEAARGYCTDNAVERFYQEVAVNKIWEGSSEIQRMIIACSLAKRGLDSM
ncbi:MAG: acyl-CoA dehydrogenase [Halioglobus sp.]|jgi:acyl-CoA dehydrogenase